MTVYEFPTTWYTFAVSKCYIRSMSQVSSRPWIGGFSVYGPHTQLWICEISMTPQIDPVRRDIAAFFSRLDGQAGLMRIGPVDRRKTWWDVNMQLTTQNWTDGTGFTDGTGWGTGSLPSFVYVSVAANRGDKNVILKGFAASKPNVLRSGDLIEIRPGGLQSNCPHLYEVVVGGSTDSTGAIGVEIRPRLRGNVAVGDFVSLRNCTSVFRLVSDDEGAQQVTAFSGPGGLGSLGFSLIEALDQAL